MEHALGTDSSESRVVIIGGGVIGAACAYYLARTGAEVTIIDRGRFGGACSHGNCGFVAPSHILPLCQPGAVWSTLKSMCHWNSAFSIRLRFDPRLWSWLLQFAMKCNRHHMLAAGHARQALLESAKTLYEQFIAGGDLTECDWHTDGLLFVHASERSFEHYCGVDQMLQREFGLAAVPYAGAALNELEPALKSGFGGGWLYECDAHLRPDQLMSAWRRLLTTHRVSLQENCELLSFSNQDGRATEILTSTGVMKAEQFVVATGAWSPLLAKQLQTCLPIQPGKGYSLTMPRPTLCPKHPLIFEEHHVAITPMTAGYRIGSTMEFAGYDSRIREERLKLLINGAKHYLREPLADPIQERWQGWRPMSVDGIPMIGRVPGLENVWVATGHSMLGVSMGPSTGKLVAELISGQTPHIDPHPYRLERFLRTR